MRPEEVLDVLFKASEKQREAFYERCLENGISEDEVNAIKMIMFTYKIYNDKYLYDTIVKSMGEVVYKEMTGKEN